VSEKVRADFGDGAPAVLVDPGTPVVEAAALAGIELQTPCGGRGKCRQCRVVALGDGLTPPDAVELAALSTEEIADGIRLGCRARLVTDATIRVPESSRISSTTVLEEGLVEAVELDPNVRLARASAPEPVLEDQRADLRRVAMAIGGGSGQDCTIADLALLRELPQRLRDAAFEPVVVTIGDRIVEVLSGAAERRAYGCAVDIGTTTVVAYLVELGQGRRVGTGAAPNPQGGHGADVVSRVEYADTGAAALQELQDEAVGVVNHVIGEACEEAGGIQRDDLYEVTVVGNTCMIHLFLGLTPHYVARAPYIPVVDQPLCLSPRETGVEMNPRGEVYILPNIAGWVGADTVGGLLATRLAESSGPTAAMDIGTNGEVMLWSGEESLVCSTAAGPAFEGAQIAHGMRAARGAVEHVRLGEQGVEVETIGDEPAVGICGSGLLDSLAVLLDLGVVDQAGKMADAAAAAVLPEHVQSRLGGEGNDRHFVLVPPEQAGAGQPIVVTQRDVRQLQLAKGAVRAGLEVLFAEAGIAAADLQRVLLAGAFGSYLERRSAVRIGLVPPMPLAQIIPVGNAAGAGAVLALVSRRERKSAARIAREVRHVELSSRPDFQMQFMETMLFPDAQEAGSGSGGR
jgi:uncharacterized 2Fe-2S/4Fe-4S cluster protein (DUF4445 family)